MNASVAVVVSMLFGSLSSASRKWIVDACGVAAVVVAVVAVVVVDVDVDIDIDVVNSILVSL